MLTKIIRISIVLLSLLALTTPSSAKSQGSETLPVDVFVSTEVSPASLLIGETALVSVKLNNIPMEGYKSAEFTCTYDGTLVEKSNIAVTELFGAGPITMIHDPQPGTFIVAIAGANSNRAITSGTAFTFSAKGLQAGQSAVQCAARVSQDNNLAMDVPSVGATLTILSASSATVTPGGQGLTGPATSNPSFLFYLRKRPTPRPTRTVIAPTATKLPQQTVIAPTATNSPIPNPTQTMMPGSTSMQLWHAPGSHDGLNPHEHGDKPPAWADDFSVVNFGHPVIFGGDERSGEMEVTMKHQAFKGVAYRVNSGSSCPVDVYFRYHAASNPMDRAFAFHSYELYMRDCKGGTSFRQGVYWVGYPEFRSQRMSRYNEQAGTKLPDGSIAPGRNQFIIGAPDTRDWNGSNGILQTRCEQWYAFAGPQGGEFSITICGATTRFSYDEHLTDYHDMSTWDLTGATGLGRRFEISLYGTNSPIPTNQPAGWFCAIKAPIEDKVEGPTHRPKWTLITNGINGPTGCPAGYLPQYTAPTFPNTGIYSTLGNTLNTKTFPGDGVVTVPN
ncbi:MAG: hypothetical protein IPP66_18805 [Anaerolineales bacterium]|nr:hypothetical protein [Anaerolineales bacterium]